MCEKKSDYRIGLWASPKNRDHRHFGKCGIIRNITGDRCIIDMQDGFVACNELIDDWRTAKQPEGEVSP